MYYQGSKRYGLCGGDIVAGGFSLGMGCGCLRKNSFLFKSNTKKAPFGAFFILFNLLQASSAEVRLLCMYFQRTHYDRSDHKPLSVDNRCSRSSIWLTVRAQVECSRNSIRRASSDLPVPNVSMLIDVGSATPIA